MNNSSDVCCYIANQLKNIFPHSEQQYDYGFLMRSYPEAKLQLDKITSKLKMFSINEFNIYNTIQYSTILYLLAKTGYHTDMPTSFLDRLFYLNKTINSIEIYYKTNLPEIFLISHGIGSVIGNAIIGNKFIFFQNTTVGRIKNNRPTIGDDVTLFPGSSVTGKSIIGNNVTISSGIHIHNTTIPDNIIVKKTDGKIVYKEAKEKFNKIYFRE